MVSLKRVRWCVGMHANTEADAYAHFGNLEGRRLARQCLYKDKQQQYKHDSHCEFPLGQVDATTECWGPQQEKNIGGVLNVLKAKASQSPMSGN